jgi:hypothetical protein
MLSMVMLAGVMGAALSGGEGSPAAVAAQLEVRRVADALVWECAAVIDERTAVYFPELPLRLAVPLREGATVSARAGETVSLLRDADGRITGLVPARASWHAGPVSGEMSAYWVVRVPAAAGDGAVELVPPLLDTGGVQRLVLPEAASLRFTAAPALRFEQHVGYFVGPTIDREARRRAKRLLPEIDGIPAKPVIYLVANHEVIASGGRIGTLEPATSRRQETALVVVSACAVIVVVMLAAYRVLGRRTRVERAIAALDADIRGLSRS